MSDSDTTVQHRRRFQASGDDVEVRQPEGTDDDDGLFRVRMPVSSTTEARDGEAFGRERLDGFARQIESGDISVFLDHGRSLGESRYSALGKVGYWDDPSIRTRDGGDELVADAVLMDPAELDAPVGDLREALATLKAQAEMGVPISSSVGWDEETGDRDVPGNADLLEISIVGIPSDPATTTTASAEAAPLARAVSAASSDFDIPRFIRELRDARDHRAEYEVNGETITIDPPESMVNAATLALAKKDEFDDLGDCGTGTGRQRARQIIDDEVGPDVVDEVAAYLTSHEEDVDGITDPPSEWSDETWRDGCGPVQYALWGGTATGTALEWAQSRANEVADAKGEELPYPERSRNLDDPEFSEGDAVEWTSNDEPVRGRVADIGDEFTPAEGVTITGDEGEAVYLIHELDDDLSPPQYRRENVAKPESSLDESQADLPPLDGNFADDEQSNMTDDDTAPDEESGDTTDEQRADVSEVLDRLVELQEEQTEMIREMHENAMDGDGDGDGDGDEEEDDDEDTEGDDGMDENAADDADTETRTVTLDGAETPVDEAIEQLRDQLDDADVEDPETTDRADGDDVEETRETAAPEWRA